MILSLLFSLVSTNILALVKARQEETLTTTINETVSAVVETGSKIAFEDIFKDYLFMFFLIVGLFVSLMHEYSNKKRGYKLTPALVFLSIFISVGSTVLIWVFYKNNVIPEKSYYGAVLFTAAFSPGIIRYLLTHLPEKLGKNVLKVTDSVTDKVTGNSSQSNSNQEDEIVDENGNTN